MTHQICATPRQQTFVLTDRERELVSLVAIGQTTKRMARSMDLPPELVDRNIGELLRKVGARNRSGLVATAFANGHLFEGRRD